jgi:putative cardiolipin synthase
VEIYELKPDADAAGKGTITQLWGSSSASLHAKTSVYDRRSLFVGSANLDPRSGKLNTELGILFESEPLAEGVDDWFEANKARIAYRVSLDQSHCEDFQQCAGRLRWTEQDGEREVIYLKDPHTGLLSRFAIGLVGLLPVEGQL